MRPFEDLERRLAELRSNFDAAFAQPLVETEEETTDVLELCVADLTLVVLISELSGLHARPSLTRLPARAAGLLGIAGFRSTLVAVYDLATLLGLASASEASWLMLDARAAVGFTFDRLIGHSRVPRSAITGSSGAAMDSLLQDVVVTPTGSYPLLRLPALSAKLGRYLAENPRPESNGSALPNEDPK